MTAWAERLAAGLCGSCGKAAPRVGRTQCAACADRQRTAQAKYTASAADPHPCPNCGGAVKTPPSTRRCYCCATRAWHRSRKKKR